MDCEIAEEMVNRYINHTLSLEEMESFLEHISTCPSCYEELETCFIVNEAMERLARDEKEEEGALDFRQLLDQDICRSQKYIRRMKIRHGLEILAVLLVIGFLAAFLIFVIMEVLGGH